MKTPFLHTAIILLFFSAGIFAQPSLYFTPEFTQVANSGDTVTLQIRTLDFTQLLDVQFSVEWTPGSVNLIELSNTEPSLEIDPDDFVINNDEGYFTFLWTEVPGSECTTAPEYTLPDSSIIFECVFVALQGNTEISFSDDPVEKFATRTNACPINISFNILGSGSIDVILLPTSTSEHAQKEAVTTLSPNPATDRVLISPVPGRGFPEVIRIIDTNGVLRKQISKPGTPILDCSDLESGLYFIEFFWEQTGKEVVQLLIQ